MGELRTLALCAGVGGLELGLCRVIQTRVVCWVERDTYAQRVLLARMADGQLDDAPIWDDITTFDAAAWRGRCDIVAAGFPCQPYSTAGKKLGADDPRDMWPHVARVVSESGASVVALENVARLVRAAGGLDRVLRDLAALGLDAEWGVVRASDAGAPHRRARLFVLAVSDAGRELLRAQPGGCEPRWPGASEPGDVGAKSVADRELAHPHGTGGDRLHVGDEQRYLASRPGGGGAGAPSAVWPPGPGDRAGWKEVLALRPDLEPAVPALVLLSPGAQPALRRVANGSPDGLDRDERGRVRDRRAQIRCLGNAVVPAQAELAFRELMARALS